MQFPRLKAHLDAVVVDGTKVFLVSEDRHYLVQGAAAVAVLPYLDGTRSMTDIALALAGSRPLPEIMLGIRKFQLAGHLADGRPDLPPAQLAHWEALGADAAAVADNLRSTEVSVLALAGEAQRIRDALAGTGVRSRESTVDEELAAGPGLTVVLTDDYLRPELAGLNAAYLAAGRRWLLARPGQSVWVGPLLQPGRTGCWACLEQRLAANRQVERYLSARGQAFEARARAVLPTTGQLLAGLLATEVARLVGTGEAPALTGTMVTLDSRTLRSTEHTLVRQPQCPACGDPGLVTDRSPKVSVAPAPVTFDADGGFRVQPPESTVDRLSKHISPYLGAVTSLSTLEGEPNGMTYSYAAGHNFAMYSDNMDTLRRNLRGQSGGKGRTDAQARASAICEAIERYTGVWRGNEPVVTATFDELGPDLAVSVPDLLGFSAAQYAGRKQWNADPRHRLHLVPEPFQNDRAIDWTAGWSLTNDVERRIPAGIVWFGHPDLARWFFAIGDSNGGASGNTVEEAIVQGFCEVVERDAVALWWYNRLRRPAVDLDSLGDPYVDRLRDFYAADGRSLWLLDITSDLGIPAFVGVSHRTDHPVQDIVLGFGAHLSPRLAALRALTEVNQFRPAVERRDAGGNTIYRYDDEATLEWWKHTTVEGDPWLAPDPDQPARTMADFAPLASGDLAANVATCVERAAACGLEVIVVDQTRPDIELNVVKVVVPRMRHFWRRLGPGRLYDVPVALGWLKEPIAEADLNPLSVFF